MDVHIKKRKGETEEREREKLRIGVTQCQTVFP